MLYTKEIRKLFDLRIVFSKVTPYFYISIAKMCSSFDFTQDLTTEIKLNIEKKWKNSINKSNYNENSQKEKFYVLSMFPYPSGNLHMGHVRVYTISDVISRFHRLRGKNVFQPIGFDAFGLPAENAAKDRNILPSKWIEHNISTMREQLNELGFSFDWDSEVITSSPDYYKFTQYLFLLLYKEGLVYREEAIVNWDPVDKTVLADEQVDSRGRSWRSGAVVEKKPLKQWFIKTTHFAQALLSGLDNPKLKDWKDIILLQRHWIGNCNGASFIFKLFDNGGDLNEHLNIWIEYPEFMNLAAFVAVTSNSVWGRKLTMKEEKIWVKSPFSIDKLPLFVTDLLDYPEGCDVKLGIPSLNEEDRNFADIHQLKYKKDIQLCPNYEERLRLCYLAMKSNLGGAMKSSKLRDWLISRQRHWGTPIPIIHCSNCGTVPVPFNDLPVKLPPINSPTPPLPVHCPKCNGIATRETDTMDTFVDSAWYFIRFTDPNNANQPFSKIKANNLLPVDVYVGGKEHAVLHLYYARFLCYFLHSIGLLKYPEPFQRLLVQGMVTGKTYYVKDTGKYLKEEEVIENQDGSFFELKTNKEVIMTWEKMSKSKFNGIEPTDVLKMYGTDTTRLLILSNVTPMSQRKWSSDTFPGILNWQKRIWNLMGAFLESRKEEIQSDINIKEEEERLLDARNFYIKGTTYNYAISHQLSVAISKLQGLTNSLNKSNKIIMGNSLEFERALAALIIMLSPIAPHFCSELWSAFQSVPKKLDNNEIYIKWSKPLSMQSWPTIDLNYELPFVCKVNNAVKETIKLPFEKIKKLDNNSALKIALEQDKVNSFISGCDILKLEYEFVDCYEATLNIVIDHLQKRKLIYQK